MPAGFGLPSSSSAPGVKQVRNQVHLRAVAVIDQHRGGAAVERARDGRTDLSGHQPAGTLVLRVTGLALGRNDDSGHAFDVGRDEDLHGCSNASRRPCRMCPARPVVVPADMRASRTALPVASAMASNSRSIRGSASLRIGSRSDDAATGVRLAVEKPMNTSPLPCPQKLPQRVIPTPPRRASGRVGAGRHGGARGAFW